MVEHSSFTYHNKTFTLTNPESQYEDNIKNNIQVIFLFHTFVCLKSLTTSVSQILAKDYDIRKVWGYYLQGIFTLYPFSFHISIIIAMLTWGDIFMYNFITEIRVTNYKGKIILLLVIFHLPVKMLQILKYNWSYLI